MGNSRPFEPHGQVRSLLDEIRGSIDEQDWNVDQAK